MTTSATPGLTDAPAEMTVEEAEEVMTRLTAPLTARTSSRMLPLAVVMIVIGAGIRLAGWHDRLAIAAGGACAGYLLIVAVSSLAVRWSVRLQRGQETALPAWTTAAAICERALPDRVPRATLDAIARDLPRAGRRFRGAYARVTRCTGTCDRLCQSVGAWEPDGVLLLIIGEHAAALPEVAAASIAHEVGHLCGRARHAEAVLKTARRSREGWLAAGASWAAAGWIITGVSWPWLLVTVAAFHAATVAGLWAVEGACDLSAARDGQPVLLALDYFADLRPRSRPRSARRYARSAWYWLSGPSHPPIWLRRALVTTLRRHRPGARPEQP